MTNWQAALISGLINVVASGTLAWAPSEISLRISKSIQRAGRDLVAYLIFVHVLPELNTLVNNTLNQPRAFFSTIPLLLFIMGWLDSKFHHHHHDSLEELNCGEKMDTKIPLYMKAGSIGVHEFFEGISYSIVMMRSSIPTVVVITITNIIHKMVLLYSLGNETPLKIAVTISTSLGIACGYLIRYLLLGNLIISSFYIFGLSVSLIVLVHLYTSEFKVEYSKKQFAMTLCLWVIMFTCDFL